MTPEGPKGRGAVERPVCAVCKSSPATLLYVGTEAGVEHRVRVCTDCYELLIRAPVERGAS